MRSTSIGSSSPRTPTSEYRSVPTGETATVEIRAGGSVWREITATDTDRDGSVTLIVDLSNGAAAALDDTVLLADTSSGDMAIGTGSHRISLHPGNEARGSGLDSVPLSVRKRPEVGLRVYTAPHAADEWLDSPASVRDGLSEGWLTRDTTLARTDTLVIRFQAEDIGWAVPSDTFPASGGAVEPTGSLLRAPLFRGVQLNPSVDRDPMIFNAEGPAVEWIVGDPANDTYWAAVNPSKIGASHGNVYDESPVSARDRIFPRFRFSLFFDPTGPPTPRKTSATVTFEKSAIDFAPHVDDHPLSVSPADNRTLAGVTTLHPASVLSARLLAENGTILERIERVTIDNTSGGSNPTNPGPEQHPISLPLDLGRLSSGSTATVAIVRNGSVLARQPIRIGTTAATVELAPNQTWEGGLIRVTSARLPEGGFVAVLASHDGPYMGHTSFLAPGNHTNLRIDTRDDWAREPLRLRSMGRPTAVVFRDLDRDEQFWSITDDPYVSDGLPVATGSAWYVGDSWATGDGAASRPTERHTRAGTPTSVGAGRGETARRESPGTVATGSVGSRIDVETPTSGAGPGLGIVAAISALVVAVVGAVCRRSR